ncbi:hypothetical protein MC885_007136, partial [Smutsia gigantea]
KIRGRANLGATSKQTEESRGFALGLKRSQHLETSRAPFLSRKPTRGCANRRGMGPPTRLLEAPRRRKM